HRDAGILLHRCAPVLIAPLQVKVLVVLHAFFIELASLGRCGRDRHGIRSWLLVNIVTGGLVASPTQRGYGQANRQRNRGAALKHGFSRKTKILRTATKAQRSIAISANQGDGRVTTGGKPYDIQMGESQGSNRDREDDHSSSPPTPPDMRVRIRRLAG